jgi:signal transduction histidine kinase
VQAVLNNAPSQAAVAAHLDEIRHGTPAMFRVTLALAFIGYTALAVVDPWLAEGPDLVAALISRAVYLAVTAALFASTYVGDFIVRHGRAASIAHCLMSGHEVVFLTWLVGGGDSSYHEALHIVMFGYALLPFPWKRWDAALVFASFLVSYNLLLVFGERMGTLEVLVSRDALLMVTVLVATVFQRVLMQGRLRDFLSRQALADANERLKALDDAKSRFFANLSHELRTPLTLIVAPLEATLDSSREPLSAAQAERMQLAHRNALRLLRLVDDLLALTRAEAAALNPQFRAVAVEPLLGEIHRDVEQLAARKNIRVTLDIAPGVPAIRADRELVDRVLLNLIGNSAKFVAVGGHIGLHARVVDGGVEIAVSDDGSGIGAEHIQRIFDRFYQVDSASTRAVGGTGIGLALVREIMELHGGSVAVSSTPGVGTTMRCRFQVATSELAPGPATTVVEVGGDPALGLPEWHEAIRSARAYRFLGIDDATDRRIAPRPRPRGDAPTVLVVEDNPDMVRFIVALMAVEYNVFAARDGIDAMRILAQKRPDLIISDVMMPGMDGFELVRRVRENPETRGIPFIFLTARGGVEDRVLGHSGGADTYLAKPFRSEELLAAAEALLARQQTVRTSSASREEEAVVFLASGIAETLHAIKVRVRALETQGDETRVGGEVAAVLEPLLDGLVTLAKAGAGTVSTPAEAAIIVPDVVARLRRDGPAIQLQLETIPAPVAFHPLELQRVVQALLQRALGVTPRDGAVMVMLQAAADRAVLVVRDEGPPVMAEQIERFFFPFNDAAGLTGDGLALMTARRIVRARGGDLVVEGLAGMGTEVRVFLPLVAAAREGTT